MNYIKIMKKNFDFLRNYGYERENLSEYMDDILQYKSRCHTSLFCGLYNQKKNWKLKKLLMVFFYKIEDGGLQKTVDLGEFFYKVMLFINGNDVFDCDMFNSDDLSKLRREVEAGNTDRKKIIDYADFIEKNIRLLA